MATKKCKYCQTEIDKKAKICPNCKKDQRIWPAKHPILTLIFVVIVIVIIASMGGSSKGSSTSNSSKASSPQENKQETIAKLNEDLTVGEVKWKVLKAWETDVLYDYMNAVKPSGKFLVINVIVENLGKDMKTVTGLKVVDDQGREFTSYSKTFSLKNLGAESLYVLSNINPNVPLTFADVYEVPADAKGLKLKVGDLSLVGTGEGLIDLGL